MYAYISYMYVYTGIPGVIASSTGHGQRRTRHLRHSTRPHSPRTFTHPRHSGLISVNREPMPSEASLNPLDPLRNL